MSLLDSFITSNRARTENASPSAGVSVFDSGTQTINFSTDYSARPSVSIIVEADEYGYISSWVTDPDGNYTGVEITSSNGTSTEDFQYIVIPNNE